MRHEWATLCARGEMQVDENSHAACAHVGFAPNVRPAFPEGHEGNGAEEGLTRIETTTVPRKSIQVEET